MMKELKFSRDELDWIYRYVEASAQTMEALLNAYYPGNEPVWEKVKDDGKRIEVTDPLVQAQLDHARDNGLPRRQLADQLADMLNRGLQERHALAQAKAECEEIIKHVDGHDERAKNLAYAQLAKYQQEEDYEIKGDISLFRLMFDAVDRYSENLIKSTIPAMDIKPDDHYPDPMRPRIFYKNKAKATHKFLMVLRGKLEKVIS